jgi:phosphatidylserine decarboxylase
MEKYWLMPILATVILSSKDTALIFYPLNNAELAKKYMDGSLVIIRLAPADYHRYHFPLAENVSSNTKIDGDYSVNPLVCAK